MQVVIVLLGSAQTRGLSLYTSGAPLPVSFADRSHLADKKQYSTVSSLSDQPTLRSHRCVALSAVAGKEMILR